MFILMGMMQQRREIARAKPVTEEGSQCPIARRVQIVWARANAIWRGFFEKKNPKS